LPIDSYRATGTALPTGRIDGHERKPADVIDPGEVRHKLRSRVRPATQEPALNSLPPRVNSLRASSADRLSQCRRISRQDRPDQHAAPVVQAYNPLSSSG
jgi:hypothetical protein